MPRRSLLVLSMMALVVAIHPARTQTSVTAEDVPVYLNGELVLRFRTASAGYSPSERYNLFEQRLRTAMAAPRIDRSTLRVHNDFGQPTLVLNGQRLVTVSAADARANGVGAWTLAHAWRNQLDRAIARYDGLLNGDRTVSIDRTGPSATRLMMLDRAEPLPAADRDALLATAMGSTDVILNGEMILRFRSSAGGFSPQERFVIFQRNLQAALDHDVDRRDVRVRMRNGEPTLSIDGQYLCTVTAADAIANGTNARTLAYLWAARLRSAVGRIDRH